MSFAEKQGMIGKSAERPGPGGEQVQANPQMASGNFVFYTVRSGDNLWEIARKYPGVSSDDIMRLNNMSSNKLKIGQILKIKPKDG